MLLAERFELLAIARRTVSKVFERLLQQRQLPGDNCSEIDDIVGKLRLVGKIERVEVTAFHQTVDADSRGLPAKAEKH